MAWVEHGLQISLKNMHYRWMIKWWLVSFGRAMNYGETATLPIDRVMGYKIYKWEFEFESHFLVHEQ